MTDQAATLLVVDDDAAIRKLVAHRMQHAGHLVLQAADGEEALRLAKGQPVDLVLLDVMMPGLDGLSVLAQLRAHKPPTSLPVIMVTAKDKGDDVIQALRLGANDYVVKPFDFQVLLQRVALHLKLKGGTNRRVGNYLIERKIGAGGMGVVYAGKLADTGAPVAIKVLPRAMTIDELFVKRFMREARLAARLDHPNVVRIIDAGKEDETYYIAMELLGGQNLGQLCEGKPLAWQEALGYARQVTDALEALQAAGILHRDIKPENVQILPDGRVKLTDFGIARDVVASERMTDTGVGVGSVIYASPEQIHGQGDFRSDIYSLGCTIFFMVTGRDPFPGEKSLDAVLRRKVERPAKVEPFPDAVPATVRQLILRLLDPRPARRPPSYVALRDELDAVLAGRRRPVDRRRLSITVALAGGALLLLALLLWRLWGYG